MTVALGHRTGGGVGRQMSEASPATRVPHDEVTRKRTSPDVVTSTVCKSCSARSSSCQVTAMITILATSCPCLPLRSSSSHDPAGTATRHSRGYPWSEPRMSQRRRIWHVSFRTSLVERANGYGAEGTCFAGAPLIRFSLRRSLSGIVRRFSERIRARLVRMQPAGRRWWVWPVRRLCPCLAALGPICGVLTCRL